MTRSVKINSAKITWQTDEHGLRIPISSDFGDVYFSKSNGLAESRYVFIDGNDLATRLQNLSDYQTFVIGEVGFGTGLNVLAIWQLWHNIIAKSPHNHTRLHIITTEKFPLCKADLAQALNVWQELAPFANQLLENYPPPLAGCHRLNFWADRFTLDIWLGDASETLANIAVNTPNTRMGINAWLLDGFAPVCNSELWSDGLFRQIARLSKAETTLATFSVAGMVKKGLSTNDFTIKKIKGFGNKREMLTAVYQGDSVITENAQRLNFFKPNFHQLKFKLPKPNKLIHFKITRSHIAKPPFNLIFSRKKSVFLGKNPRPMTAKNAHKFNLPNFPLPTQPLSIAVVGAGVAGLCTAWALAMRGHNITLIDSKPPLSGASGNPRAVIAPKLTELQRLPSNLHAIGYLASLRYYPALTKFSREKNLGVFEQTGVLDILAFNRVTAKEVAQFPPEFCQLMTTTDSEKMAGMSVGEAIFYPKAGLVDTHNFAKAVLSHPHINFLSGALKTFEHVVKQVKVDFETISKNPPFQKGDLGELYFDHLILCTAQATCNFLPHIKPFNFSRGQVSWFPVEVNNNLPKLPLKYGGYCGKFRQDEGDDEYFLLGASFIRDTLDTTPTLSEQASNLAEFENALDKKLDFPPMSDWQGRAGIRSQTVDYLPLVGQVGDSFYQEQSRVWTFSALGSKGYCYAPVCAELLAGLICGEMLSLDKIMVEKLSPNRKVLQKS